MGITQGYLHMLINGICQLDGMVQQWVHTVHTPWLAWVMQVITYMGFSLTYIIVAMTVSGWLLYKRRLWEAVFLNLSLSSAWVMMGFLKDLFARSRPMGEALTMAGGYSFPSGHAMLSMACYGFLAGLLLSYSRSRAAYRVVVSLYILVFLIGISRVYLNVHYLSDVLVGFILGFIIMTLSLKGMRIMKRRSGWE